MGEEGIRDSGFRIPDFLIPNTHFPIPIFFTGHSHETENLRQPEHQRGEEDHGHEAQAHE